MPAIRLEFVCELEDGHLTATKVAQVPEDARLPDRETGAVGVHLVVDRMELPPDRDPLAETDPGVKLLEGHFARLADRRWGGFVEPLRQALEAEASDDEDRTQRLTVRFTGASMVRSGDEDIWKIIGIPAEAVRAIDDGEWLEILDPQGRSMATARVIYPRAGEGSIEVGVRGNSDPPRAGFIRPRSRKRILDQKRGLLDELESPTGSLPHLVRLVAAPASIPVPRTERPPRFVNPAVLRNRSQARAVGMALGLEEGQAMLIQGPPGTGKSTTAAEIDIQLIMRDPGVRILVCSHSNHGTDNMLMKVLPYLDDAAERIARVGFYDRVAREARPFFAGADADLGDRNIIFTTIDALAFQDIAGGSIYDYVIVDEANRAGVLDTLLALARGKRMILVGDAMQLQPVMSEAEQQMVAAAAARSGRRDGLAMAPAPGGNNVIGKSLFAWLLERHFAQGAAILLDQQNRMHPAIGELVSRTFYSGHVRTGPAAPRRGTGLPFFPSPVTWVDTRGLKGNRESRVGGGTSLINVAEGRLVTSITRYVASHAPPGLTVGVIAAYAEQRELLRRMMGPRDDMPAERQLEIDTVDAFEGREKDIIVLSLVRSNKRRDVGFLRLEQRLNVAVSRARRLILIVGDTSTLRGGYFNQLVPIAGNVGQIVPAPKILAQLGGGGGGARTPKGRRQRPERPVVVPIQRIAPPPVAAPAAATPGEPPEEGDETQTGTVSPSESRRRRRRRAWERRRDRVGQTELGGPNGAELDGDTGGPEESEPDVERPERAPVRQPQMQTPPAAGEPGRRSRRRRRRSGDRPGGEPGFRAQQQAGQPSGDAEAPESDSPQAEPTIQSGRRPARGRRGGPPMAVPAEAPTVVDIAPVIEAAVAAPQPAARRGRPVPASQVQEPLPIEVPAAAEAPQPKRIARPRAVAVPVEQPIAVVEAVQEPAPKPARAPRKAATAPVASEAPASAAPVVAAVTETPAVAAPRARKAPAKAAAVEAAIPQAAAEPTPAPAAPRRRAVASVAAPAPEPPVAPAPAAKAPARARRLATEVAVVAAPESAPALKPAATRKRAAAPAPVDAAPEPVVAPAKRATRARATAPAAEAAPAAIVAETPAPKPVRARRTVAVPETPAAAPAEDSAPAKRAPRRKAAAPSETTD